MIDSPDHIDTKSKLDLIRADFPLLSAQVNNHPLVYFDNGATAQKPKVVIDAMVDYYTHSNSNVHRGVHLLSQQATSMYEEARKKTQIFINANSAEEIIFTKGTTDSINLLAHSLGASFLQKGDQLLVTEMEHHSNFVPWQSLAHSKGCDLKVVPLNQTGGLNLNEIQSLLNDRVKILAITHASNTLGSIIDINKVCAMAHQVGALVVVDGAQYVPHHALDVQALDCDFYVFSAHKLFGPTGIGVLYGKNELLQKMTPYQLGGGMIDEVTLEKTTYASSPQRFEAGTPHIAGAIGMGTAMDYLGKIGYDFIANHEATLFKYAYQQMDEIEEVEIYSPKENAVSLISFNLKNQHPFDVGSLLDQMGIAVRTGHHCTQPIMAHYNIPGTVRISFAFYNTQEEIDVFIHALKKVIKMLY